MEKSIENHHEHIDLVTQLTTARPQPRDLALDLHTRVARLARLGIDTCRQISQIRDGHNCGSVCGSVVDNADSLCAVGTCQCTYAAESRVQALFILFCTVSILFCAAFILF